MWDNYADIPAEPRLNCDARPRGALYVEFRESLNFFCFLYLFLS